MTFWPPLYPLPRWLSPLLASPASSLCRQQLLLRTLDCFTRLAGMLRPTMPRETHLAPASWPTFHALQPEAPRLPGSEQTSRHHKHAGSPWRPPKARRAGMVLSFRITCVELDRPRIHPLAQVCHDTAVLDVVSKGPVAQLHRCSIIWMQADLQNRRRRRFFPARKGRTGMSRHHLLRELEDINRHVQRQVGDAHALGDGCAFCLGAAGAPFPGKAQ